MVRVCGLENGLSRNFKRFIIKGINRPMSLFISISVDYGAEEFFWKSSFTNSKELIKWWLEDVNLDEFEKSLKINQEFYPIIHNATDESLDKDLIYELFLNNPFHISIIDTIKEGCYLMCEEQSNLICENQKIFKNGKKITLKPCTTTFDMSKFE